LLDSWPILAELLLDRSLPGARWSFSAQADRSLADLA
jgi:hypothetical protein